MCIRDSFAALAEGHTLPIVIYNIPIRTGVNIEPDTVAALRRRFPRVIVGIKEASGSLDNAMRLRAVSDIKVLCGDDALTLPMMSVGATGVVSVASNVVPPVSYTHLTLPTSDLV